ncbi:Peptidyl-prolyl cis-trans isomerase NIMA-interacting 4, partial [Lemmus lemmus]
GKVVREKWGKESLWEVTVLTSSLWALRLVVNAVKVRHSLYEKQGNIKEAMEKLKSGMRFSEEAAQHSTAQHSRQSQTRNGLCWMTRGSTVGS